MYQKFSLFLKKFSNLSLITLAIEVYIALSSGPIISYIANPPDCIFDNWVFENDIIADEPFANSLQMFQTCVSINKTLCVKLVA